jgi:hypothetical protein
VEAGTRFQWSDSERGSHQARLTDCLILDIVSVLDNHGLSELGSIGNRGRVLLGDVADVEVGDDRSLLDAALRWNGRLPRPSPQFTREWSRPRPIGESVEHRFIIPPQTGCNLASSSSPVSEAFEHRSNSSTARPADLVARTGLGPQLAGDDPQSDREPDSGQCYEPHPVDGSEHRGACSLERWPAPGAGRRSATARRGPSPPTQHRSSRRRPTPRAVRRAA